MANLKIVVCGDEDVAKAVAASLKTPPGGGFKTVDGPFPTDFVLLETFGLQNNVNVAFGDTSDFKTFVVIGRMT